MIKSEDLVLLASYRAPQNNAAASVCKLYSSIAYHANLHELCNKIVVTAFVLLCA